MRETKDCRLIYENYKDINKTYAGILNIVRNMLNSDPDSLNQQRIAEICEAMNQLDSKYLYVLISRLNSENKHVSYTFIATILNLKNEEPFKTTYNKLTGILAGKLSNLDQHYADRKQRYAAGGFDNSPKSGGAAALEKHYAGRKKRYADSE
jgi:hypothetical protein